MMLEERYHQSIEMHFFFCLFHLIEVDHSPMHMTCTLEITIAVGGNGGDSNDDQTFYCGTFFERYNSLALWSTRYWNLRSSNIFFNSFFCSCSYF